MAALSVSFEVVPVDTPEDVNVILGQAHFIKTVDDLHEVLVGVSPYLRFGVAFCEASGARLVRRSGNDDELVGMATAAARAVGAGHMFAVMLRDGFAVMLRDGFAVMLRDGCSIRSRRYPWCARSSAPRRIRSMCSSRSPIADAGSPG